MPSYILIYIPLQVLFAHLVVNPSVSTLKHRLEGFNAIRMGPSFDVFPNAVIYCFVPVILFHKGAS